MDDRDLSIYTQVAYKAWIEVNKRMPTKDDQEAIKDDALILIGTIMRVKREYATKMTKPF